MKLSKLDINPVSEQVYEVYQQFDQQLDENVVERVYNKIYNNVYWQIRNCIYDEVFARVEIQVWM